MGIKVLQPGLFTSVQDSGRWGYQKEGVVVGGAMDQNALQHANLLVGNAKEAAGLEITLRGPELLFEEEQLIALTGAPSSASLEGAPILVNRPVWVKAGSLLKIGAARRGCRSYLAISGGVDVPLVLGSASTYLRAGWGGYQGRALQQGDLLSCFQPSPLVTSYIQTLKRRAKGGPFAHGGWSIASPDALSQQTDPLHLRVMHGPEWHLFDPASQQRFWEEPFIISPQSDRMGFRLQGANLVLQTPTELLSSAVTFGTIQVPAGGQAIILGADRQTTGGYPRIAQVISADLSILAQARPGTALRFQEAHLAKAQQAFLQQQKQLHLVAQALVLSMKYPR